MAYRSPVSDIQFILEHVVGYADVRQTEQFADATEDTVTAILAEAAKLCDDVMAPLNRGSDLNPARLENGVVRTSPGFADAYAAIATGGWVGLSSSPDYGGMGLPIAQTIIKGLHGDIWVENNTEAGTSVFVTLPAVERN